jgi:hypothetical protein
MIMANTVVGIFDNEADAQQAQNYLLANGYADGNVDIKTASYKSEAGETAGYEPEEDFFDKISNFFKDLFGDNDEDSRLYSEAGRRGTIVTVHAVSNEEAEAAAAILDQFGSVDVKANASRYSSDASYTETDQATPVNVYGEPRTNEGDGLSEESLTGEYASESRLPFDEESSVNRDVFQTGSTPARSLIVQRQVQEGIRLRQQQASLNREYPEGTTRDTGLNTFSADRTVADSESGIYDRSDDIDVENLSDEERIRRTNRDSQQQ